MCFFSYFLTELNRDLFVFLEDLLMFDQYLIFQISVRKLNLIRLAIGMRNYTIHKKILFFSYK